MELIIRMKDVQKQFGSLSVLSGVTLDVPMGQTVGIIGPSGSGKSTLLRLLIGLDRPTGGSIEIDGEPLWLHKRNGKDFDLAHLRRVRAKIGMVFQQFNLFPHMSALDNIMEAPIHVLGLDRAAAKSRAEEYLDMVGLADRASAYPGQLSGGQKQRVAIARALAMRPKVMLFDEITSALDPELVGGVLAILQELASTRSMSMIIVTHHMKFAERCAERVLFFDQGRIVEDGAAESIFTNPVEDRTHQFLDSLIERDA